MFFHVLLVVTLFITCDAYKIASNDKGQRCVTVQECPHLVQLMEKGAQPDQDIQNFVPCYGQTDANMKEAEPSYWCTAEEEEEVVNFETRVSDNENKDATHHADNMVTPEAVHQAETVDNTEAPAEHYCDCLAPSECATLVDLFHQGRFHELTYFESCGYYEYQPYFCCPPLTTDEHQQYHESQEPVEGSEHYEYHTEEPASAQTEES